jgi:hypothetical protein
VDEVNIEQRALLPGKTASQWSGIALVGGAAWLVGTVGAAICGVTVVRQTGRLDPVTVAFLALFAVGFAVLALGVKLMERKARKEIAAGYTTMAQGHYEVERRHSPTGVVMRAAGQPPLTREQWERAMQKVRTYRESQKQ